MNSANLWLPNSCVSLGVEALEQKIYDHLLCLVRSEQPEHVLRQFRLLFLEGKTYPDADIRMTLATLVRDRSAKDRFLPFFNRCCFTLINRWQQHLLHKHAVVQLVDVLKQCRGLSAIAGHQTPSGRLRFFVQEYLRSPLFQRLDQLADVLNPMSGADTDEAKPLSVILHRYPFLYPHCLANQEDSSDYQKVILQTQQQSAQRFDQELSRYLSLSLIQTHKTNPNSQTVVNPTLLSHEDLCRTLKRFTAKVDSRGSYKEMADHFWRPARRPHSYGGFKDQLYDYVVSSVPPKYGQCRFNQQLKGYLEELYVQSNDALLTDSLVVRTCNQLMNFLVIESRQRPNHWVFLDLLNNLGSTATIGLLLKIVLLCGKSKAYLERRLSFLFQHYAQETRSKVKWLVLCFEKVRVAWSAHFGSRNLAYANLL